MGHVQQTPEALLGAVRASMDDHDEAAYARFLETVVEALRAGLSPQQIAATADLGPDLIRIIGLNAGWPAEADARRIERHQLLADLAQRPRLSSAPDLPGQRAG